MTMTLTAAHAAKRGNSRCGGEYIFTPVSSNGIFQNSPATSRAFSFNGLISMSYSPIEVVLPGTAPVRP